MTRQAGIVADAESSYRDLTDLVEPGAWTTCMVGRQRVPLMLRRRERFSGLLDVESYYRRMRPHLVREGLWPEGLDIPALDWSGTAGTSRHHRGTIYLSQADLEEITVLHELAHYLGRRRRGEQVHGEAFWSLYLDIVSVCIAPDAGLALSIYAREYAERKS